MIELHRLNGKAIVLNCDLIELMEATPDTVITLSNGNKMVVKESVANIVDLIVEFRQRYMLLPSVRE